MKHIEHAVKKYLQERGWDNLKPADLAKSVSIEAAELLELFQWSDQTLGEARKDKKLLGEVKKELADVFIYAFDLAVLLGIDTEQAIRGKLRHIKKKYPAKLMKVRDSSQEPGMDARYLKIKRAYRRKGW